jgi:hypothetical protein
MQVNPVISNPFDGCSPSPLVIGSGLLLVQAAGETEAESIGNVELVGFAADGDDVPVFPVGENSSTGLAVYTQLRFDVNADFFSVENLARYLNTTATPQVSGFAMPLEIVREAPPYRVIFQKDLSSTNTACNLPDGCTLLQITLWRAHFQVQFDLGFQLNTAFAPNFAILANPDAAHPAQPYGVMELVCPSVAS